MLVLDLGQSFTRKGALDWEDMLARSVYDSDSVRHLNQVGLGISALTAALLSMSGTQLYVWIGETGVGRHQLSADGPASFPQIRRQRFNAVGTPSGLSRFCD